MPIGRAAQRPDLIPTNAQLRGLLEYVREARLDQRLPVPVFGEEGFLGEAFEGQVRPRLWVCGAGVTVGGIRADGRIGACPELGDAFLQGDVRTERFRDVWESRYQLFRDRSWTRKGNCASCEQFRRCRGGSLHLYESPDALATRCLFKDVVCGQE
jgi:radical SAM protein with 4Fe4S-binding SPASM domain